MLKVLDVEGAVRREGCTWTRTGEPWTYDEERYRAGHEAAPRRAGGDVRLRPRRALPDGVAARAARRPGTRAVRPLLGLRRARGSTTQPDAELVTRAQRLLRSRPIPLTVRRQTPRPPTGRASGSRPSCSSRRAARSRGPARAAGARGRRGPAARAASTTSSSTALRASSSRGWPRPAPRWVAARAVAARAPSSDFARRLARARSASSTSTRSSARATTRRSARWRTRAQQVANVRGQFRVRAVAEGAGPARRRRPLLGLDARDRRRPAAPGRAPGPIHPLVLQLAGA